MYSRKNPSPRYTELVAQYKELHIEGEKALGIAAHNTFAGFSILPHVDRIKRLIQLTESFSLLDYGCGKGLQYQLPVVDLGLPEKEMLTDYWELAAVQLYDPCYQPYSTLPEGVYDGVISTDMLEHCAEEDAPWIVDEMFSFAKKFLFANVACYPAKKTLPNGENAHCIVKDSSWWANLFETVGNRHSTVVWEVIVSTLDKSSPGAVRLKEVGLSGGASC